MRVALPLVAALTAAALSVLASAAPVQAMDYSYRTYKGHVVVDAVGSIEKNEVNRFLNFLGTLPPNLRKVVGKSGNAVVFDSPGGLVIEATALGLAIEGNHFATGVAGGGQCSSACVLAWAMGTQKSAAPDSHIGIHNATLDGIAGHDAAKRLESLGVSGKMGEILRAFGREIADCAVGVPAIGMN